MTSGVGTPGKAAGAAAQARGDGSPAGPGSTGEQPGSDRIGSARVVIGMAAWMLTLLCIGITFITWTVSGVTVLGSLFFAVFFWAIGAHRWSFWAS